MRSAYYGMRASGYYSVYPRYGGGSPALVDMDVAEYVAREEQRTAHNALRGRYGHEQQVQAERWGMRGIAEQTVETRKGWQVFDLITGEIYLRPFDEKMRKDGWMNWDDLPEYFQQLFADQKPPETDRRYWFKHGLVRDREGNLDWRLTQWEPQIEGNFDDDDER